MPARKRSTVEPQRRPEPVPRPGGCSDPARPTTKGDINGLPVLIKPVVKLSIFGISQASAIPAEHAESRTFGRAGSLRPTGDR